MLALFGSLVKRYSSQWRQQKTHMTDNAMQQSRRKTCDKTPAHMINILSHLLARPVIATWCCYHSCCCDT